MFLLDPVGWRGLGPANWAWAFNSKTGGVYQPLAYLTYGLDYVVGGLDPRVYHLQNVLWHAAAAGLLALLTRRLLLAARPGADADVPSALAGALFAVHPLRVESVTWLSERRDVLCVALSLACVWSYVRARQDGRSERPALVLFLLALLAKGMAVTLPAVLWLVDRYPLKKPRPLKDKLPYFALSLVFFLIGSAVQHRLRWGLEQHGLMVRVAQSCYAAVFYLAKTVWPSGLSPFYELRPPLDWTEPVYLLSVVAVLAAACLCRKRPEALAAYAVVLLPVSGLFQFGPQLVADRYAYLATAPFFVLLAAWLRGSSSRKAAATVALAVLVFLCVRQQSYWRSNEALWSRVLAVDPVNGSAHLSLGVELARQGRPSAAEPEFRLALAAFPGCAEDQERLARLGPGAEGAEAEALRRRAEWSPVCRKARTNLGAALAHQGRFDEARAHFVIATFADPGDEAVRRNLARLDALRASGGRPAKPRTEGRR